MQYVFQMFIISLCTAFSAPHEVKNPSEQYVGVQQDAKWIQGKHVICLTI